MRFLSETPVLKQLPRKGWEHCDTFHFILDNCRGTVSVTCMHVRVAFDFQIVFEEVCRVDISFLETDLLKITFHCDCSQRLDMRTCTIFKKGDKWYVQNYRLISLTSATSKIVEHTISEQIATLFICYTVNNAGLDLAFLLSSSLLWWYMTLLRHLINGSSLI